VNALRRRAALRDSRCWRWRSATSTSTRQRLRPGATTRARAGPGRKPNAAAAWTARGSCRCAAVTAASCPPIWLSGSIRWPPTSACGSSPERSCHGGSSRETTERQTHRAGRRFGPRSARASAFGSEGHAGPAALQDVVGATGEARAGGFDRERRPPLTPGRPCSSPNPGLTQRFAAPAKCLSTSASLDQTSNQPMSSECRRRSRPSGSVPVGKGIFRDVCAFRALRGSRRRGRDAPRNAKARPLQSRCPEPPTLPRSSAVGPEGVSWRGARM